MELVREFSTTVTSALIRAIMSPLRSSEKKLNGKSNSSFGLLRDFVYGELGNDVVCFSDSSFSRLDNGGD